MKTRKATKADFDRIKEIHAAGNYSFPCPDLDKTLGLNVVEDDGKVVAVAWYKRCVEVFAVMDPQMGSAQRKLSAFGMLHPPLCQDMLDKEVLMDDEDTAIVCCDVAYPTFPKWLESMGWAPKRWAVLEMTVARCKEIMRLYKEITNGHSND